MELDYYVYHIGRPGMSIDEGYIGVSKDPERRLKEHRNSEGHVGNALRKYDDAVMTIIKQTTEQRALEIEEALRPEGKMGWNMAPGGGKPPMAWGRTGEAHPMYGKYGKENPVFKGPMIGTCIKTGKQIKLYGPKEIKEAGFHPGEITMCVNGNKRWKSDSRIKKKGGYWSISKQHKGYTWKRGNKDD